MDVAGEYTFDAPRDKVWEALKDPEVLGAVMPGGQGFEQVGEDEYAGMLNVKVGPVQGKFKGNIKLTDIVAPESYTIDVDGKGAPGFVKATGSLKLTEQGEQTHMYYEGEARVGGRIASVGQRLLDASAKSIIRQSLEGLNDYLNMQSAAEAAAFAAANAPEGAVEAVASIPVPAYKPPSQTHVAVNLAKDVAAEYVPAEYRPLVLGAAFALLLIFVFQLGRASK